MWDETKQEWENINVSGEDVDKVVEKRGQINWKFLILIKKLVYTYLVSIGERIANKAEVMSK